MAGDIYRDPSGAAMRRLTERRAQLPTLSPLRLALLDDTERGSLDALVARVDAASRGDIGSAAAFEAALHRLEQTLDAFRQLTDARLRERGVPKPPAHSPSGSGLDLHLLVAQWMLGVGGAATPWGSGGALGRFERQGVRLLLALEGSRAGICGRLRAAAPLALASVHVKRRGLFGSAPEIASTERAILLGEPRFDTAFAVEGNPHSARALLTGAISGAFLALDTFPSLALERGTVELRWDVTTPETNPGRNEPNPWRQRSQVRIEHLVPAPILDVAVDVARALED